MTSKTPKTAPTSALQQSLAAQGKGIERAFKQVAEKAIDKDKKQFSFLEEILR